MSEPTMAQWEANYDAMRKKDRLLEEFFERHNIPDPLTPEVTFEAFESALVRLEARLLPYELVNRPLEDDGA